MKLLEGKKGLVLGVLNEKSIAWGIAKDLFENGAEMALTYLGEAGEKRVVPMAQQINCNITIPCNVSSDEDINNVFKVVEEKFGKLDFLIHAIAFSDKNELRGDFVNTTRENFKNTLDISCYSLIALARGAKPLMVKAGGGSILSLTYFASEKVIPNYNAMAIAKSALETSTKYLAYDLGKDNIRVNCISSGPIKTLASSGIGGISNMLKYNELNSPLKRNVSQEDNGKLASFLVSESARNITGEIIHLDAGFNIMGMKDPKTENIVFEGGIVE